jgi:hypothetical protein
MVGAPAPAPVAPAPVAPVAAAIPARGQATLARWGKGKVTGQTTLTPSALRFLASTPTTQIACNVAAQPKLPQSTPAARFLASYAYKGTVAKGNKTTIEALVNLYNAKGWGEKLMYADLAWDVNHGFVLVNGVNGVTL